MSQLSETAEKALCRIYRQSAENQKIELNLNTPIKHLNLRMKILRNQFPYDMEEMCERWGI